MRPVGAEALGKDQGVWLGKQSLQSEHREFNPQLLSLPSTNPSLGVHHHFIVEWVKVAPPIPQIGLEVTNHHHISLVPQDCFPITNVFGSLSCPLSKLRSHAIKMRTSILFGNRRVGHIPWPSLNTRLPCPHCACLLSHFPFLLCNHLTSQSLFSSPNET